MCVGGEKTFRIRTTKHPKPTIPFPAWQFVANYLISLPFIAQHVTDKKLLHIWDMIMSQVLGSYPSRWYDLGTTVHWRETLFLTHAANPRAIFSCARQGASKTSHATEVKISGLDSCSPCQVHSKNSLNDIGNVSINRVLKCDVIILQTFPFEPLNLIMQYTQLL